MLTGFLLVIGAGLLWAFSGSVYSRAAQRGIHPCAMIFSAGLMLTTSAWALLPQWSQLAQATRTGELAFWMAGSGLLGSVGITLLQVALMRGPQSVVWGIGQAALAVPFVAGVALHGEHPGPVRWAGLATILTGLGLLARPGAARASGPAARWIPLALSAFVLLGCHQTFMSWPSFWTGWSDVAHLRVPIFATASTTTVGVVLLLHRVAIPRQVWLLAVLSGAANMGGQRCIVAGLDHLAGAQMASAGYPMSVASCIAGFAAYSILAKGERPGRSALIGLGTIIAGALLLAG